VIRPPRADELEVMLDIERDAGRAFADIGMDEIARDDPGTVGELEAFRAGGRAWVAVDEADQPVAYARLGVTVVEPAEQAPELAALVRHEAAAIPGDALRVAMRRPGHVLRTPR
jgi:hypothetical protein